MDAFTDSQFLIIFRILALFLALLCQHGTNSKDVFSVDCISNKMAFLVIDPKTHDITLPLGCLNFSHHGNYSLTTTCLSEKHVFIVSPKYNTSLHLTGGKSTRVFSVTCDNQVGENGASVKVVARITPQTSPTSRHYPVKMPGVNMFLTTSDPLNSTFDLYALPSNATVNLGDKLYLVVLSFRQTGSEHYFIPQECDVISAPPFNLTVGIWRNDTTDRQCLMEPSLIDEFTVLPEGRKVGGVTYNMAYAPVYAFYFQKAAHNDLITYTCSFRVCPASVTSGECPQELKHLASNDTRCVKVVDSQTRSRRDVDADSQTHMPETETLSASIHVLVQDSSRRKRDSDIIIIGAVGGAVALVLVVAAVIVAVLASRRKKQEESKRRNILERNCRNIEMRQSHP